MRILLIDLGGAHGNELLNLLTKHQVKIVPVQSMTTTELDAEGVVLAGSYHTDINSLLVEELVVLLAGLDKPLAGIGQGFNVVCKLYGVDLESIFEKASGGSKLVPTDDGAKIFQGTDPLVIKTTPRWLIDELPKSLQVLARSEGGIEAVRHKQKPVIAIQQQFDDFVYPSDGKLVYTNIFGLFGRVI
jgi:anthranilate/para-aminobenzoate synthase component II